MSAVTDILREHAIAHRDAIAIDPVTAPKVTFEQLDRQVRDLTVNWTKEFASGRPIAIRMDHGVDEALSELAALAASLPVLSLPNFFTKQQTNHAIATCGAQAIVDSTSPQGTLRCRSALAPVPLGTARITFTSGSTGAPKGVCLSAQHMFTVAYSIIDAVGAKHAGRHLALLPPGILLETVGGFLPTLLAGGTYVCPPQDYVGLANPFRPDFAKMLSVIEAQKITSLILVPEYLAGLIAAMESSDTKLPLLTLVAVGGARVPPALIARSRALGLPVRQGYGLTECASVVSLEDGSSDVPGSAGIPLNHMSARIAEDGEIILDGPSCLGTIGGDSVPETKAAGQFGQHSFATGDVGRIDDAGRLWIEGRKSNVIITSFGRNVSPEWVEAALLAQPEIMQAMVYGDGLPALQALLVPARPDSDLSAAVAAANATLPEYAHIGGWREAAHFMPENGRLTGNGRIRRQAIAETYLGEEMTFFDELDAATVRQRIGFLAIPQLQAGLNGTITLQAYLDYLAQAYHHVSHTVPLMRAARARLAHRPELIVALDEYIEEEEGHEEWILNDINAAGGDGEAVRASAPAPATAAMVAHAYDKIENHNPVSFFGMVFVLESVSIALATRGASAVATNLGLPPKAFSYLTSHGALDQEHMIFFANLVNGFDRQDDRDAVVEMAKEIFDLFGGVFSSIDLAEQTHVAA